MIPEIALIELLQARYIEQGVERCPEVPVVAIILTHGGIEHMMGHLVARRQSGRDGKAEKLSTRPAIL